MACPSSFFTFDARSFWLNPLARRASDMRVPNVFIISPVL
jgi:hypothetical protein